MRPSWGNFERHRRPRPPDGMVINAGRPVSGGFKSASIVEYYLKKPGILQSYVSSSSGLLLFKFECL